jgi:hypothetical protein
MDVIDYEPFAYYIFDRAYVDYDRLLELLKQMLILLLEQNLM